MRSSRHQARRCNILRVAVKSSSLFKQIGGMGLTWKNMTAQQELSFRGGYAMRPRENSWKIWPRDGEEEVIGCPSETGMIRNPPCLSGVIF